MLWIRLIQAYSRILFNCKYPWRIGLSPVSVHHLKYRDILRKAESRCLLLEGCLDTLYRLYRVLGCACLLPNGTGCTIRGIRRRHSSNLALPPTARKPAVLLRNWRQRTEPETFQNERKCRRGADCIICSGVCNTASAHSETSCIVATLV